MPPALVKSRPFLAGVAAAALGAKLATVSVKRRARAVAGRAAVAAARAAGEKQRYARALGTPGRATLLAFYSPECGLCRSIGEDVREIAADEGDWLDVVALNAADGPTWAPELLHYAIGDAPAFVLLDGDGRALAKTGPVGRASEGQSVREALLTGLDAIVESGRPKGK